MLEPIAIIGMGVRVPGARNPDEFWRLLSGGQHAIREIPADRWDVERFFDPDAQSPGTMATRWGGFLDEVDKFDPYFFGISPREAQRMDPQQRLLLELAWETLEDAGIPAEQLAGSLTSVYVGFGMIEYCVPMYARPEVVDAYTNTGSIPCIMANRISYLFDLRGPSLAMDTACSSSLVSVHLACQSLRSGESTMALAGGVNFMLSPGFTVGYSQLKAMSPTGRCHTFDARANGYVRGEGGGLVLLKPLQAALRDGDQIYAVIRGSAVNQDGRTNGLTAPNRFSQEEVLRRAYANAHVEPGAAQYIEAHGTGTLLGDPIEAGALGAVIGAKRPQGRPCAVGSVKTNIGHLESAAGVAALIKTALAIKHRMIPPSLNFEAPNPHIPFEQLGLKVQTELESWPSGDAVAGVSGFGFGGTNAHVVLAEAPQTNATPPASTPANEQEAAFHFLPLSARSADGLAAAAAAFRELLQTNSAPLQDICYNAGQHRSHHDFRLGVVGASKEEVAGHLQTYLQEQASAAVSSGRRKGGQKPLVAFLYSGQGAQYSGMGRRLYDAEPVFRDALDRCAEILRPLIEQPLLDVMFAQSMLAPSAGRSLLDEDLYAQAALFALEYGLTELWRSWGIEPDFVLGHGVGEIVAACVSGESPLEDGMRQVVESNLDGQAPQGVTPDAATACDALGQPARFAEGVAALKANRCRLFVEVGPQSTLLGMARRFSPESEAAWLPSLSPDEDDVRQTRATLAALYARGAAVDFGGLFHHRLRPRVKLPLYPFQRVRIWDANAPGPRRRDHAHGPAPATTNEATAGACQDHESSEQELARRLSQKIAASKTSLSNES